MPQQEHENIQGHSSPDSGSVITSFDELTKVLATGPVPRRKALRWMGGALIGAVLASVPGAAWANERCSEGQTHCGDRCVNLQTLSFDPDLLQRQVRQSARKREALWQLLQPLRRGAGVRGRGVPRRLPE